MVPRRLGLFIPQSMLRRFRICFGFRSARSRVLLLVLILNVVFLFTLFNKSGKTNETTTRVHSRVHRRTKFNPVPKFDDALESLKLVDIRKFKQNVVVTTSLCPNLTADRPPVDLAEPQRWQMVVDGIPETFVFSAYYDSRLQPPVIKIIGMSSGIYMGPSSSSKYCQLWYREHSSPVVSAAEYIIVPETHDRKYAASFHICFLSPEIASVPYAVSLVKEKCQAPNNVLKVVDNIVDRKPDHDFTVCVTPFNFNYDNVNELTEFIEVNRMFGAQKFIFYNYTTGPNVDRYLRVFTNAKLVQIVQWRVPVVVDVWPPDPKEEPEIHYFAQLASINDCLYRSMFRSRFVVFSDLDEVIVPRNASTWNTMLNNITREWQREFTSDFKKVFPGGYLIQNVFFYRDWPDDDKLSDNATLHELGLFTLLKTKREPNAHMWYVRSKYIVWSRMASMLSVHSVLEFIDNAQIMHVMVSEKHALLHHYRHSLDSRALEINDAVIDRRMHNFQYEIITRAKSVHKRIG